MVHGFGGLTQKGNSGTMNSNYSFCQLFLQSKPLGLDFGKDGEIFQCVQKTTWYIRYPFTCIMKRGVSSCVPVTEKNIS